MVSRCTSPTSASDKSHTEPTTLLQPAGFLLIRRLETTFMTGNSSMPGP